MPDDVRGLVRSRARRAQPRGFQRDVAVGHRLRAHKRVRLCKRARAKRARALQQVALPLFTDAATPRCGRSVSDAAVTSDASSDANADEPIVERPCAAVRLCAEKPGLQITMSCEHGTRGSLARPPKGHGMPSEGSPEGSERASARAGASAPSSGGRTAAARSASHAGAARTPGPASQRRSVGWPHMTRGSGCSDGRR